MPEAQNTLTEASPLKWVRALNRRQTPRISLAVPLEFRWHGTLHHATTALVNDGGALVLSPVTCPVRSRLVVRNMRTGGEALFEVTWCWVDESQSEARCRLGLRILASGVRFWGPSYTTAREAPLGRDV